MTESRPARPGMLREFAAVLFDLDGVITPTAEVHMRAWGALFTPFLAARGVKPYEESDYYAYIDGKPRYEGVASLLSSRAISLPFGAPSDAADAETICGLGNRKNAEFAAILATDGVRPYPGSVALLDELLASGIAVAVVSSSKNADAVLRAAGLRERFGVVVDGVLAAAEQLPGKPEPDTFVRAATLLGKDPGECVVVEDAISGVAAGAAGGFGLVVGVDRGAGANALAKAGANVVVNDLAQLCEGKNL